MLMIQRIRLLPLMLAFLLIAAEAGAAPTGTLQQNVVTFSDSPTATIAFTLGELGQNENAEIDLQFRTDGEVAVPAPTASPFPNPATVMFSVHYGALPTDGGTTTFQFTAAEADTPPFPDRISTSPPVRLAVLQFGKARYRFRLTFTAANGNGSLSEPWTISISGLPANVRGLAFVKAPSGTFTALTPGGAATCPECEDCDDGGGDPQPPWHPCVKIPELCEVVVVDEIFKKKPGVGPWCLSCPRELQVPVPEDYERVMVSIRAMDKEGKPLGAGKPEQVQFSIKGGKPIGGTLDVGSGRYAQVVEYRSGSPPRVSAKTPRGETAEIVAGTEAESGGGVYRALTFIFGTLLAGAGVGLARLMRQRTTPATRG